MLYVMLTSVSRLTDKSGRVGSPKRESRSVCKINLKELVIISVISQLGVQQIRQKHFEYFLKIIHS